MFLLSAPQISVVAVLCQQADMITLFHHYAIVQYQYLVGVDNSRQAMSDGQACVLPCQLREGIENGAL